MLERDRNPSTPVTMLLLARALLVQSKFDEAERLLIGALDRIKWSPALSPAVVSGTLQSLAVLYSSAGKYREAEIAGDRALTIVSAAVGPPDPDLPVILFTLGQVKSARGKTAGSQPDLCACAGHSGAGTLS